MSLFPSVNSISAWITDRGEVIRVDQGHFLAIAREAIKGRENIPEFIVEIEDFVLSILGWIKIDNSNANVMEITVAPGRIARHSFDIFVKFLQVSQKHHYVVAIGNIHKSFSDSKSLLEFLRGNVARMVMPISVALAKKRIESFVKSRLRANS